LQASRTPRHGIGRCATATRRRCCCLVSQIRSTACRSLYRWRTAELEMIRGAPPRSAQSPARDLHNLDFGDIPFHHLPVTKEPSRSRTAIWNLVDKPNREKKSRCAGALYANPLLPECRRVFRPRHQHPSFRFCRASRRASLSSGPQRGVKRSAPPRITTSALDGWPEHRSDGRAQSAIAIRPMIRTARPRHRRRVLRARCASSEAAVIRNGRKRGFHGLRSGFFSSHGSVNDVHCLAMTSGRLRPLSQAAQGASFPLSHETRPIWCCAGTGGASAAASAHDGIRSPKPAARFSLNVPQAPRSQPEGARRGATAKWRVRIGHLRLRSSNAWHLPKRAGWLIAKFKYIILTYRLVRE